MPGDGSPHKRQKYTVSFFNHDAVVSSHDEVAQPDHLEGETRGAITELSFKSRQRLAFTAVNSEVVFRSMLTCTVHPDAGIKSGVTFKNSMKPLLQLLRDRGNEYLWFLEFQKNGSPHIHILLSRYPDEKAVRGSNGKPWFRESSFDLSSKWAKYVSKAIDLDSDVDLFDPRFEAIKKMASASCRYEPITSKDGGARYACKYAYKTEQKSVPFQFNDVGRFWGCTRGVRPRRKEVIAATWEQLEEAGFTFFDYHDGERSFGGPMKVQFGKSHTN